MIKHRASLLSRLAGTPRCRACGHQAPCNAEVEGSRPRPTGDTDPAPADFIDAAKLAFTADEIVRNMPRRRW